MSGFLDAERRDWRRDSLALLALAACLTILFGATRLDLVAAGIFYRGDAQDHWPLAARMPWSLLYRMAPWITASLVLGGIGALGVATWRRRSALRRQAIFVLMSVILGPGLLINGIFKDHWDRPRPRDVIEFGGELHYAPAPLRGEGGKSFPCGHCSVGFLYALGWWIWRRQRPYLAAASLATGIVMGAALGIGRMAAGGHFLSDVLWSGFIALGLAHGLYYYLPHIPVPKRRTQQLLVALTALGGVGVLLALFALPHGRQIATDLPLSSFAPSPRVLEVTARTADVHIVVVDEPADRVSVAAELHGFGLPGGRLGTDARFEPHPEPTLRYTIVQQGWFTDLDAAVSLRVPSRFDRIIVRLEHGNIQVSDASRDHVVDAKALHLDLQTGAGRVSIRRE